MSETLFGREWEAPSGGDGFEIAPLRLRADPGAPEELVICRRRDSPPDGVRRYDPLTDEPALFRTFADTEPTPEGCLAFANRYGMLGASASHPLTPRHPGEPTYGEPVRVWRAGILWLRYLLELWDWARGGGAKKPSPLAERRGELIVLFHPPELEPADLPLASGLRGKVPPAVLPTEFRVFDVRPLDCAEAVASGLRAGDLSVPATAYCVIALGRAIGDQAPTRPRWDSLRKCFTAGVVPADLWVALCVQFLLAVEGLRNYARCPVCRRWFEVGSGVSRSHKAYCSGSCRTRATRQKEERALRMHARGMTPRQIAAEIDSKLDVVKGWIASKKLKGK